MRITALLSIALITLALPWMSSTTGAQAADPTDRLADLNAQALAANVDLADAKRRFHLGFRALYPSMPFWTVTYGTFSPPAVSRQAWIFNPTTRPAMSPAALQRRFGGPAISTSPGR